MDFSDDPEWKQSRETINKLHNLLDTFDTVFKDGGVGLMYWVKSAERRLEEFKTNKYLLNKDDNLPEFAFISLSMRLQKIREAYPDEYKK